MVYHASWPVSGQVPDTSCCIPIAGAGIPLMAAGGGVGVVTVWNLEERKLHTIIRDAHDAPVTRLHFFPGEPRLMSAGAVSDLINLIRIPLAERRKSRIYMATSQTRN